MESKEFYDTAAVKGQNLLRGLHGCSSTNEDEVQFYKHFKNLQKEDSLTKITKSLKKKPKIEKKVSTVPNMSLENIDDIQKLIEMNPVVEEQNKNLSISEQIAMNHEKQVK